MNFGFSGGLLIVFILFMMAILTGIHPDWDKEH